MVTGRRDLWRTYERIIDGDRVVFLVPEQAAFRVRTWWNGRDEFSCGGVGHTRRRGSVLFTRVTRRRTWRYTYTRCTRKAFSDVSWPTVERKRIEPIVRAEQLIQTFCGVTVRSITNRRAWKDYVELFVKRTVPGNERFVMLLSRTYRHNFSPLGRIHRTRRTAGRRWNTRTISITESKRV